MTENTTPPVWDGGEWDDWYRLTPQERWRESQRLWAVYLAMGGSLEPDPDPQSPFYDPDELSDKGKFYLPEDQVTRKWAATVKPPDP